VGAGGGGPGRGFFSREGARERASASGSRRERSFFIGQSSFLSDTSIDA